MIGTGIRKMLDRAFTATGVVSIAIMAAALVCVLAPMIWRGIGAVWFKGTVEFSRVEHDLFRRGDKARLESELAEVREARRPVFEAVAAFEKELEAMPRAERKARARHFTEIKDALEQLFGATPWRTDPVLLRDQYGDTRWEQAMARRDKVLFAKEYDYSDPTRSGIEKKAPRAPVFRGTALEPLFRHLEANLEDMMRPRRVFYFRFLFDRAHDAHFFGGIGPELLGTFYLTLGAILFAVPLGVLAAIYLVEYARPGRVIRVLRTCVSTLAGVPSIVFGLFGLAFFINAIHVSPGKSVLAGSLTLGLLILPTIIRASEEALKSVPATYKEAALSLGAGPWRAVVQVILPAALPGILTGIIISMGRAAGETAPIIFTAAVSVGLPVTLMEAFSQPTPALSWNVYNLATEHVAVDEIRHVQYGMVTTLILLVLLMNVTALALRAKITRRLRG